MIKLTVKKGGGNSSFINNRLLKPIAGFAKTTQIQVKIIIEFHDRALIYKISEYLNRVGSKTTLTAFDHFLTIPQAEACTPWAKPFLILAKKYIPGKDIFSSMNVEKMRRK